MDDYEILKYLGLEVRDQHIVFYDEEEEEYLLDFSSIKEISIEKAFTPIEKKVGFWAKLYIDFGLKNSGFVNRDHKSVKAYWHDYEIEIELTDHRVLSRKVRDINLYEVKAFIEEINNLINAQ